MFERGRTACTASFFARICACLLAGSIVFPDFDNACFARILDEIGWGKTAFNAFNNIMLKR
jgi:hypothetical protein